ncbi:MAG: helix-turn-helix transcriptional regulator [Anderseniella sp.]|nr:helix-turn-helix transcriptional regulator [Anderseniella sp.]
MTAKMPNPIDVHVGSRLRMRRMLVGMSQEKLGEHLDLTFQQVQKYEKGSNRISASRLFEMARILDVPVQFFFDDMPGQVAGKAAAGFSEGSDSFQMTDFLSSSDGAHLIRAFAEIKSPDVRRKIIDLVKAVSSSGAN